MGDPDLEFLLIAVAAMSGAAAVCFAVSAATHRVCRARWPSDAALIAALSASWYCVSMSLTLFNRLLLGYVANASFPVSMSLAHMAVKGLLAVAVLLVGCGASGDGGDGAGCGARACARPLPRLAALVQSQHLTRGVVWGLLAPLGAATALDVLLSAVSISLVDVSVYTVAKSTAIVFTLGFSLLARLQRLTPAMAATMAAVVSGVVLCSIKDSGAPRVNVGGVLAALAAAACGAGRWVLTERYFSRRGAGPPRPLLLIALLAPATVATLLPGLAWELPRLLSQSSPPLVASSSGAALLTAALLGGGALAFLLLIVELQLVSLTSALTLNVIGHAKDVFVIGLAIPVFHEVLSPANAAGVALTAVGTVAYSVYKARARAVAATASHAAAVAAAAAAMSDGFALPARGGGSSPVRAGGGGGGRRGGGADADAERLELLERRELTGGGSSKGDATAVAFAPTGAGDDDGGGGGGAGLLAAVMHAGGGGPRRPRPEVLQRVDLDFDDSDDEEGGDDHDTNSRAGLMGRSASAGDTDALDSELDAAYANGRGPRAGAR